MHKARTWNKQLTLKLSSFRSTAKIYIKMFFYKLDNNLLTVNTWICSSNLQSKNCSSVPKFEVKLVEHVVTQQFICSLTEWTSVVNIKHTWGKWHGNNHLSFKDITSDSVFTNDRTKAMKIFLRMLLSFLSAVFYPYRIHNHFLTQHEERERNA